MKLFLMAVTTYLSLSSFAGQLGFMTKDGVTKPHTEANIKIVSTIIVHNPNGQLQIDIIIKDNNNRHCIVGAERLPNVDLVALAFNLQNSNSSIVCQIDDAQLPLPNSTSRAINVWITTQNFN